MAERRVHKADGGVEITTLDAVDRSRLTVETLKWHLCKLAPKKYGDKLTAQQRRNFLRFLNRHELKQFLVFDDFGRRAG